MHSASILTGIVTIEEAVDPPVADRLSNLLIGANTLSTNLMSATVTSPINANGDFRITGIRPGKVSLFSLMQHSGSAGPRILRIERNGMEIRDGIDVRPGEDINGLRIVMGIGSSVLRGDVKIEGGALEGVNLYVLYRPTNGDPHRFFRADLDARRHFVIKDLTPGEYELVIGPMSVNISGVNGSRMMNRMPTVKQTVAVGAGAEVEVSLTMILNPEPPHRP
jgi:hypothetical protein